MRPKIRITLQTITIVLLAGAVLTGCDYKFPARKPEALKLADTPQAPPEASPYIDLERELLKDQHNVNRETNASDIAARLSEKYGKAVEDLRLLQEKHRSLAEKDKASQGQIGKLKVDLARAEKELSEANTMLLEMKDELSKWKQDVLGFRNEMRQSQKAMLNAVTRLTVVISGGVAMDAPPATAQKTQPAPIAANTEEKTGGAIR